MRGEVSDNQLALAEAKAQKILLRNRKNSRCHEKGNDSKTIRPGKGKHGFNLSRTILEASYDNYMLIGCQCFDYEPLDNSVVRRGVILQAQYAYNHISERFWLGQRVEVESYGLATVTCLGGYKCCCGYSRSNKGIGVTYDDGRKYHCDARQLLPCDASKPAIAEIAAARPYSSESSSVFSIVATSLDGNQYLIPELYPCMTLREFKQCVAGLVGTPYRLLHIVNLGQCLAQDAESIGGLDLARADADISFCREQADGNFWNILVKELFVAIVSGNTDEARHVMSAFVECKGAFRLAHMLKNAYVTKNTLVADFVLGKASAEVLFQALVMKVSRTYSPSKYRRRMAPHAKPSTPLIGAMYLTGDFSSLCLVGSRLTSKWRDCVRHQSSLPNHMWEVIEKHMNGYVTV